MLHQVKTFKSSFAPLFQKGFPSFLEEDGRLISQAEDQALLVKYRLDHRKFEYMAQSLSAKIIFDKLAVDFELVNMFRTIGG